MAHAPHSEGKKNLNKVGGSFKFFLMLGGAVAFLLGDRWM